MSVTVNGSTGLTFNDGTSQSTSAFYGGLALRNRIINGAMVIDQRNAGASVTPNYSYTLDRWLVINTQTSKLTVQQNAGSVTPPVGFSNYLGVTSSSAYSVGSGDTFFVAQRIEGFNTSDLGFGTANASTVTLSFWVRSSLTGTFSGSLQNGAGNRSYPFTYVINAANTWEQKTITVAGDTSGTWIGATNGIGLRVNFNLGSGTSTSGTANSWQTGDFAAATGSTSVVGTNGATFYITGVQLEKGSTATSFDYRPYGTELALCQRYYYRFNYNTNDVIATVQTYNTVGQAFGQLFNHPVPMRATPTTSNTAASTFKLSATNSATGACTAITIAGQLNSVRLGDSASSGVTTIAGGCSILYGSSTAYIDASAEL